MSESVNYSVSSAPALVVFMGGANDIRSHLVQSLEAQYAKEHTKQKVVYLTWNKYPQLMELIKEYHNLGSKIAVIAHSWGADVAVNHVLIDLDFPIDFLATLDPVGRQGLLEVKNYFIQYQLLQKTAEKILKINSPILTLELSKPTKPVQALKWINIYIDYTIAKADYDNTIARIGGAWGACVFADMNHDISAQYGNTVTHASVHAMFEAYVQKYVSLL